jgi:hypothetical protein
VNHAATEDEVNTRELKRTRTVGDDEIFLDKKSLAHKSPTDHIAGDIPILSGDAETDQIARYDCPK